MNRIKQPLVFFSLLLLFTNDWFCNTWVPGFFEPLLERYPHKYVVRLQNQSEHSGVMVRFVELDTFTITNPYGHFYIDNLPDGAYTLEARYPYFRQQEFTATVENGVLRDSVNLELEQLLQFWIAPAETTLSMSYPPERTTQFEFEGLVQYLVNITDEPVSVGTVHDPVDPWAFVPTESEWSFVPTEIDTIYNLCSHFYGSFRHGDFQSGWWGYTFDPGDTIRTELGTFRVEKDCFQEGDYLFLSCTSDCTHYPEYFYPRLATYLVDGGPKHNLLLYERMNQSLLKKHELFRPALVHLVN